jgi:hypothetical protein
MAEQYAGKSPFERAKSQAVTAAVFGLVYAALTAVLVFFPGVLGGYFDVSGINLWVLAEVAWADIAVIALLSVGVFAKSRVCALLLLFNFVAHQGFFIYSHLEAFEPHQFIPALVFLLIYLLGVKGAFTYRRIKKDRASLSYTDKFYTANGKDTAAYDPNLAAISTFDDPDAQQADAHKKTAGRKARLLFWRK